ncbi:MAG: hypothetical protein WAT91_09135, partial [Saprospiraceae bacterium]
MHGFESIRRINGSFYFKGAEIIEDFQQEGYQQRMGDGINAFNHLTFVGGDFTLPLYDFFHPINGFTKLDSVGHNFDLNFRNSDHTFPQSNHFKFIGGDISIDELDSLKDLQCFKDLTRIFGKLTLMNCTGMQSLSGLENITMIDGDVTLRLYELNSISSLSHLNSIGGGLEIYGSQMVNLVGLSHLKSIGGGLVIYGSQLVNLDGLDSVLSLHGPLILLANYNLESLAGIEAMDPTGFMDGVNTSSLYFAHNSKLSFCGTQNICEALRIYHKTYYFKQNAEGCNGPEEIQCNEYSLSGTVFYDANQNKMQDSSEHGIPGIRLHIAPDDRVVITDENGLYVFFSEENTVHVISLEPDNAWLLTTDSSQYTRLFQTGLLGNTHNDFGIVATSPFSRIAVNLTSDQERCNRLVNYYLKGYNESSKTISGRLLLIYDSAVAYVNGDIAPDSINPFLHLL